MYKVHLAASMEIDYRPICNDHIRFNDSTTTSTRYFNITVVMSIILMNLI